MTSSPIRWDLIRAEYEQGASLRTLEADYGKSASAICRRAQKEGWERGTQQSATQRNITPLPLSPVPLPADAHSLARNGLSQLARHLQTDGLLDIKDHKLLSDALAQYVKVLVTAPQEQQEQEDGLFIPLGRISPETRMEIRRLLALDAQEREQVG